MKRCCKITTRFNLLYIIYLTVRPASVSLEQGHDPHLRYQRQSGPSEIRVLPDLPGTWCYMCYDLSSNDSLCEFGNGLLKSQDLARSKVAGGQRTIRAYGVQRCGGWFSYCMIEEVFLGEKNQSSTFTRDCSHGEASRAVNVTNTKLEVVPSDNKTRCMWDTQLHGQVCLTICEGDFCNGPQYPLYDEPIPTGTTAVQNQSVWLWLFALCLQRKLL